MKLIIDIPKGTYDVIQKGYTNQVVEYTLLKSVQNGIPLDDVKAEISRKANSGQWSDATVYGMKKALAIIDKHISGKENE